MLGWMLVFPFYWEYSREFWANLPIIPKPDLNVPHHFLGYFSPAFGEHFPSRVLKVAMKVFFQSSFRSICR